MMPLRYDVISISDLRRKYDLPVGSLRRWTVRAIFLGGRTHYWKTRLNSEAEALTALDKIKEQVEIRGGIQLEFWPEGPPVYGSEEWESTGDLYFNYWGVALGE